MICSTSPELQHMYYIELSSLVHISLAGFPTFHQRSLGERVESKQQVALVAEALLL